MSRVVPDRSTHFYLTVAWLYSHEHCLKWTEVSTYMVQGMYSDEFVIRV